MGALRNNHHHSPQQGVSAPRSAAIATAPDVLFGDDQSGALWLPFHPFPIEPFDRLSRYEDQRSEGEKGNVRQSVGEIRNV